MKPIILVVPELNQEAFEKIDKLTPNYQVVVYEDFDESQLGQVEILFGWNNKFNQLIDQFKSLKWIQLESAGVDYLPREILDNPQIIITTVSGIHASAITESVFAYILSKGRGMYQSYKAQQAKEWLDISADNLHTLPGKSILIFGTGNIGKEIGRMAHAFGMKVRGVNTDGRPIPNFSSCYQLDEARQMLNTAHIIVNAMPLTPKTKHFFNRDFFSDMNNHAIFINIGRGPSVVEEDLYQAIKNKEIAGAYLDVFEEEPLNIHSPLWSCDRIVITPHITGQMNNYYAKVFPIFIENLCSYQKEGQLTKNRYQPERGY